MSEVINEFWKSGYGKGLLKTAATQKKAFDQDSYWESEKLGPTQDEIAIAHPQGGTDTAASNAGAPEGDAQYTGLSQSPVGGDGHVETVAERAPVMEEVARKAPTGVQGSRIKGLAKTAKKGTLAKLAQLADRLDELELTEEANMVDEIIKEEVALEAKESEEAAAPAESTEEAPAEEATPAE